MNLHLEPLVLKVISNIKCLIFYIALYGTLEQSVAHYFYSKQLHHGAVVLIVVLKMKLVACVFWIHLVYKFIQF